MVRFNVLVIFNKLNLKSKDFVPSPVPLSAMFVIVVVIEYRHIFLSFWDIFAESCSKVQVILSRRKTMGRVNYIWRIQPRSETERK
jgi:hypothetical protein